MLIDAQNILAGSYNGATGTWTGKSVGTTAGVYEGTNVIDLKATNTLKDIGSGREVYLVIGIVEAVVAASTDGTVTYTLGSDATTTINGGTVHWTSAAQSEAAQVAGYVVGIVALPRGKTYERYLGITTTIATQTHSAGTYFAFLTTDPEVLAYYSKNYTIS